MTLPAQSPAAIDFSISRDLQSAVCLIGDPNQQAVVFNGTRYPSGDLLWPPRWTPSWDSVAWSIVSKDGDAYRDGILFVDGKEVRHEGWFGPVEIDATGKTLAYWYGEGVRRSDSGPISGDAFHLVHGKKELTIESGFPTNVLALSPNGKKLAYNVSHFQKGKLPSTSLFLGKKELGKSMFVPIIHWGGKSSKLAFQTGTGMSPPGHVFLEGEKVEAPFLSVAMPVLDAKGKRLAYLGLDKDGLTVVAHKTVWEGRWDLLGPPVWDPKGKKVAAIANQGADPILRDALAFGAFWFQWPLTFLQDRNTGGFRLAKAQGRFFLLIDGEQASRDYLNASEPVWDAKSSQVAFRAKDDAGWRVVVGDKVSDAYDLVTAPRFDATGKKVGFGALKGSEVWWQVMELAP